MASYLPDDKDISRLPRYFIVNLLFTVVGAPIKEFISKRVRERNDEIAENRNLMIEVDAAVAAAFKQSVNISSKYFASSSIL